MFIYTFVFSIKTTFSYFSLVQSYTSENAVSLYFVILRLCFVLTVNVVHRSITAQAEIRTRLEYDFLLKTSSIVVYFYQILLCFFLDGFGFWFHIFELLSTV